VDYIGFVDQLRAEAVEFNDFLNSNNASFEQSVLVRHVRRRWWERAQSEQTVYPALRTVCRGINYSLDQMQPDSRQPGEFTIAVDTRGVIVLGHDLRNEGGPYWLPEGGAPITDDKICRPEYLAVSGINYVHREWRRDLGSAARWYLGGRTGYLAGL
jgi:hypothetical protein